MKRSTQRRRTKSALIKAALNQAHATLGKPYKYREFTRSELAALKVFLHEFQAGRLTAHTTVDDQGLLITIERTSA